MNSVLIVDSEEFDRELLVQVLEGRYLLRTASDGAAGWEMARELQPDAILLELTLPKMDGWELTRRIKADEKLRRISLVAVTALAMKGDEEKARAVGCDGYVTKPIDHDLLYSVLTQLLEKSEH